jgi:hypothetical protein
MVMMSLLAFVGSALGLPGPTAGLSWLERLFSPGSTGDFALQHRTLEASETTASMVRFQREVFQASPVRVEEEEEREPEEGQADTEVPPEPVSIVDIIYSAAAEFGLSGDYLLSVAECESGLDPSAVNAVGYYGLFQFDQQTWAAYGYGSVYDPVAQAYTAARLLAAGQSSRWPNCT